MGEMKWPDGRKYKGIYLKDKRHGHGCFVWPDGRQYCGEFFEGLQHGCGRILQRTGRVREGEWRCGKRIRWLSEERRLESEDGFQVTETLRPSKTLLDL
eukprot:symbB.v1.2.009787.t1/scaffold574.1/size185248/12